MRKILLIGLILGGGVALFRLALPRAAGNADPDASSLDPGSSDLADIQSSQPPTDAVDFADFFDAPPPPPPDPVAPPPPPDNTQAQIDLTSGVGL